VPQKINFAPIDASDAKDVHDLQKKLFPSELTESVEEIEEILANADKLFNCNHSFAVYDNLTMIGYVFAYVDSNSIFHHRSEEIFYCKEFGLLPGYEKYLRPTIFKLISIWLTYAPQLAMEAHAVEEAKNKWLRLLKIQQQFEIILKTRQGDREDNNPNGTQYFFLRWEAGLSGRAEKKYSLPRRGWQYQPSIVVNVISDANRLEAVRKDWNKLLDETSGSNFLGSLNFIQTWWKYFGTWQDLYVIVIRRNDEVIGIAPLMKESWNREGLFEQELSIIGEANFTVLPQLLFAKNEDVCLPAMMAFLSEKENASTWQRLVLARQRSSNLAGQVADCLSGSRYNCSQESSASKVLQLGNDFQRFVEKQLPTEGAYNSLLGLQTDYEYVSYSDIDSSQQVVSTLSALEEGIAVERQCINQSHNHYFFYSALIGLLARENKLRWYVCRKDNKVVASSLGFVENNVFYLLMQTHHDECPAEIDDSLLLSAVKELTVEGVTQLAFGGQDLYKNNSVLLGEESPLTNITIFLKDSLIGRLKSKLKNLVS